MGMSTHCIGFKPPDDHWLQMKAVWDACVKAMIEVPEEVDRFFNGETPDDSGVEIRLDYTDCCSDYSDGDMRVGIEIDLDKVPKGVKAIRFVNSY